MFWKLGVAAIAALGFTFSPYVSKASADWQAYYDELAKLQAGEAKFINSRPATIDKLRAGQEKRRDNYLDAIEKARMNQQAWIYWHSYPNYYGRMYGQGTMPLYYYQVRPTTPTYSPGGP